MIKPLNLSDSGRFKESMKNVESHLCASIEIYRTDTPENSPIMLNVTMVPLVNVDDRGWLPTMFG